MSYTDMYESSHFESFHTNHDSEYWTSFYVVQIRPKYLPTQLAVGAWVQTGLIGRYFFSTSNFGLQKAAEIILAPL